MVAAHVPAAAKSRALGMSFTGFHTGQCCAALCCAHEPAAVSFCFWTQVVRSLFKHVTSP